MTSIRTFDGEIRLCRSCGQPCFYGDSAAEGVQVWQHFREQWDGVYCPRHPLSDTPVAIGWDELSLKTLKANYPDTFPR
jgi:hypothetical protein